MANDSSTGGGPDREARDAPGDTSPNPTGTSSEKPAEGPDDIPPEQPGSPDPSAAKDAR